MEPAAVFNDHEPDDIDDSDAIEQYAAEVVAAAEAFGVPIPADFPLDQVAR